MKITKSQLKQIIKEELESVLTGRQPGEPPGCEDLRPATEVEYKQWKDLMRAMTGEDPAGLRPPEAIRDLPGEIPLPGDIPRGAYLNWQRKMWRICPEAGAE
jgi:hypothetical protein